MSKTRVRTDLGRTVQELRQDIIESDRKYGRDPLSDLRSYHFEDPFSNWRPRQDDLRVSFGKLIARHLGLSTPEQRLMSWLNSCASGLEQVASLIGLINELRDEKRRRSPFPNKPADCRVESIGNALTWLANGRQEFLTALQDYSADRPYVSPTPGVPWSVKEQQTAQGILRRLAMNANRILPPLAKAFPRDRTELALIGLKVEQFRRSLWELHERVQQLVVVSLAQRLALLEALDALFGHNAGQRSKGNIAVETFLDRVESAAPRATKWTILDAFNSHFDSPFDPRRYRWFKDEPGEFDDLSKDLVTVGAAVDQLSPFGQSFVTVAALGAFLSTLPRQSAYPRGRRHDLKFDVARPIICEFDFTRKPSVMPSHWPLAESDSETMAD